MSLYALILAGGVGSRLWPRSRSDRPKQMLDLTGERSMLQQTVDRIRPLIPPENVWIMTNAEYVPLVREQLPELPAAQVVGEPSPRGTAPAIGLGAEHVFRRDPAGVMFALHADHFIEDEAAFRRAMEGAAEVAGRGYLVSLGVTPTRAETGYGYVELGDDLAPAAGQSAFEVRRFVEKPDAETARRYVDSGQYLWNSGIFCWRVDTIRDAFAALLPEIHGVLARIGEAVGTEGADAALAALWGELPPETTIDRGIMERAERVATVPMSVGWNDVGAWDSLAALAARDGAGNSVQGAGESVVIDSRDVYVYSEERFVAVVGVENLVVVDSGDALLVVHRDRAQEVKKIVEHLKAARRTDLL